MIRILALKDRGELERIRQRSSGDVDRVIGDAKIIIEKVKKGRDKALFECSKKFDNFELNKKNIEVSKAEIKEAYKKVDKKLINALKVSISRIKNFSKNQMPKELRLKENGIEIRQIIRPIEKVGCYIPAGNYPLPSSVLMTVVPAKVAGVREVVVCTPPKKGNEAIIVAAHLAGADKLFRVGGAHAIAALAYGTESIPKVGKIVGPGNVYVTAAKKLLYGEVGIDFLAGPSEVLIYAENGNEKYIAADMLAQSEHDKYASAILVTTSKKLADKVSKEIENQLKKLPTRKIAEQSLNNYGAILIAKNRKEAISFINDFAPEHLELFEESILKDINNAGAIFLGENSCEAAGDYAVGPSHVLPTGGVARFRSGLSVYDFIKMPSVQKLSAQGLKKLKPIIAKLAECEGLLAHKRSAEIRR
ncbi:MAG TPA: histidinol dehydrogenase [Candidatus Nanoarchaeia archaeon]|nr:histidinol dehydrogenase [Candidatus Nanoarchaeia archaeon]